MGTTGTVWNAPPPGFPLHGVADGGRYYRALDWIHTYRRPGADDAVTYGLWLVHLAGRGGIRVGTFSSAVLGEIGPDPTTAAALHGAHALADLTLPTDDLSSAPGIGRHATGQAHRHDHWPTTTWQVDGRPVAARVWSFAGGWTGLVEVDTEIVVGLGVGTAFDQVRLVRLADTRAYGFDHTGDLDRTHHRDGRRDWHESLIPRPNRSPHADHRELVGR